MMKAKYVPDLSKQMALCEANYARILKLLPDIDLCEQRDFIVDMAQGQSRVSLSVQERFKFTSTLVISQSHVAGASLCEKVQSLMSTQLLVRLYHDAKMAEVIRPFKKSQFSGKYSYPNKSMYQIDDKIKLNDYLAQWLSHCLTHGYQSEEIMLNTFIDSN